MIRPIKGINDKPATIVIGMANLVRQSAPKTGQLRYVALHAYFSTGSMILIFETAVYYYVQQLVHVIVRAKKNYVMFLDRESFAHKYDADGIFTFKDWYYFSFFSNTAIEHSRQKQNN